MADPDAVAANQPFWFICIAYQNTGYIKDDEKDQLNDETRKAILEAIRQGTEAENQQRRKNGWPALSVVGWQTPPFYDDRTKNLTWSLLVQSSDAAKTRGANYNSRLLGRGGVLSANMVLDPVDVSAALPAYEYLVSRIRFVSGHTYGEYRSGDQTAAYGLTALATGGTAVAVAKGWKGFAKLGVLVVAALVGIGGAIKSVLFGKRATAPAGPTNQSPPAESKSEPRVVKCGVCGQSNRLRPDLAHPMCGKCGAILS